jgi:hypothetical protein
MCTSSWTQTGAASNLGRFNLRALRPAAKEIVVEGEVIGPVDAPTDGQAVIDAGELTLSLDDLEAFMSDESARDPDSAAGDHDLDAGASRGDGGALASVDPVAAVAIGDDAEDPFAPVPAHRLLNPFAD